MWCAKNGSGMTGMNTTNIRNLEFARPSNVINVNNVSNQFSDKQLHPATFPEGLVEFFVKSFTNENDIVYGPVWRKRNYSNCMQKP